MPINYKQLPKIACIIMFLLPGYLKSQKLQWFDNFGGTTGAAYTRIHIDSAGFIYCTGSFQGTIDFDPSPATFNMTSSAAYDAFLLKLDPQGNFLFAIRDGGSGNDWGNDIVTDGSGNIYWVGSRPTGFLFRKFSSSGSPLFNLTFGGSGDQLHRIALDTAGDLVMVGEFTGTRDFDPSSSTTNLVSMGQSDMCMTKFSTTGNFIWAINFGSTASDWLDNIVIDPDNSIWVAGTYTTTFVTTDFDPGPAVVALPEHGIYDFMIGHYSSAGNYIKAIGIGSSANEFVQDLLLDSGGNVCAGGYYGGTINLNPDTILPGSVHSTSGANAFVARYNDTLEYINSFSFGGPASDAITSCSYLNDATIIVVGNFADSVDFDPDTMQTNMQHAGSNLQEIFIATYDTSGALLQVITVGDPGYGESMQCVKVSSIGEVVTVGQYVSVCNFNPRGIPVWYNMTGLFGSFVAKYNFNLNEFGGRLFLDGNNDTLYQSGEPLIANSVIICQPGNMVTVSDQVGNYHFLTDTLQYTVQTQLPTWFTPLPAQHNFGFSSYNNIDSSGTFGMQVGTAAQDLQLYATPWVNVARRNETFNVSLNYRNLGTTSPYGTVWLTTDTMLLDLQSVVPAPDTISGDSIGWNFPPLSIFSERNVLLNYHTTLANNAGDTVCIYASIATSTVDATPADNSDTIQLLVAAAHDPNIKVVSPADSLSAATALLDYTIHFQNTGNSYAQTIYIRDTLSPLLDLTTLQIISSSYPVEFFLDETGNSVFLFENIMLPDSNTNEPQSHGFVRYRIRPISSLQQGDTIRNTSYIHFDFEEPVVTNTTRNYLALVIPGFEEFSSNGMRYYPNPTSGSVTLETGHMEICTVTVSDVTGRLLYTNSISPENGFVYLDLSSFPDGQYLLTVKQNDGLYTRRIILIH